jgi:isocitrate dehydrogenase
MQAKTPITIAYGDGIGPEIMEAALTILREAGAPLDPHPIEIGEKVYLRGHPTGIEPSAWDELRKTKVFFKAPITTPQGGGFRSLNVTIRTAFGLYANVRPCTSYFPFIETKHPQMDLIIIRENEEDLYAGIEYRQTPHVTESLKLISQKGCEKIVRYAFEYASVHGRKKVTCFTKDNIMKFTDGLFHRIYEAIGKEYPHIEKEHWIVDIGAAKLATAPQNFDVLVLPNLYGDILSDVAAQISGSVGLAGSANIGERGAMFEAIHGSAPRRAGQNMANPSGLILASCLLCAHIGQGEVAQRIHDAWLTTIEEGIHPYDIYRENKSQIKVGTKEFATAVCKNLGKKPHQLRSPSYAQSSRILPFPFLAQKPVERQCVGVDLFIFDPLSSASQFVQRLRSFHSPFFTLSLITNRGARIWPEGQEETSCIEQWRCRFLFKEKKSSNSAEMIPLLQALVEQGFDLIKIQPLYLFDQVPGFSSAEELELFRN